MLYNDFIIIIAVSILSAVIPILIYQFTRIKYLERKLNTLISDSITVDEIDDDLTLSEKISEIYEEINDIYNVILTDEKLRVIEENTKIQK